MGTTKTQIFTTAQNELATIFKVLSNPARIAIIQYISRQQSCICNDIVAELGLAHPPISPPLPELKSIGLLKGEVEGKTVCYCIDLNKWNEIQSQLNSFFNTTQANCW